jgi:hypothetical protein
MRHVRQLLVVVATVTACAGPATTGTPPPATEASGPPTSVVATSTASPVTSSTPAILDLSARAQVWFGPLPPLPPNSGLPFNDGSVDYLDIWQPDAPWSRAARRVQVFTMGAAFVKHYATDDQLKTVIEGVRRHGMALALEVGPLPGDHGCGVGVEGFGGVYTLDDVKRIQNLGGRVDVVALDEPFAFGRFWDGPSACHWTTERIAQEVAAYMRQLRKVEPDVTVGDNEPIWRGITADDFGAWVDAYRQAAGEPLAFFHMDADWDRPDWPDALFATEQAMSDRDIPVGIFYNGGDATSDADWVALAMQRAFEYEQVRGGRPDHIVFESWFDHPDRLLPETDPTTYTGFMNRYFGERTTLRLDTARAAKGRLVVDGHLTSVAGKAVAGRIGLEATPLDGQLQLLERSGVAPSDASEALIVFRVNTAGGSPAAADLRIYEVAYREEGDTDNRVFNPRFSRGLEGWGAYGGDGRATVVASDRGPGRMLRIRATRSQSLSIDSTVPIDAAPGAGYRLSVRASVPAASAGSAYVAVIFLKGTEIARNILRLDPSPMRLSTVNTTTSGQFEFGEEDLEAGRYLVDATYAGDLGHWPAQAEPVEVRVG